MSEPRPPSRLAWIWRIILLMLFLFLAYSIISLNLLRSGQSKEGAIYNNLLLIDESKQQWVYEHGQPIGGVVTMADLDLLNHKDSHNGLPEAWLHPVGDERYVVGTVTEKPEAQLLHQIGYLPKGTIIRLQANGVRPQVIFPTNPP